MKCRLEENDKLVGNRNANGAKTVKSALKDTNKKPRDMNVRFKICNFAILLFLAKRGFLILFVILSHIWISFCIVGAEGLWLW